MRSNICIVVTFYNSASTVANTLGKIVDNLEIIDVGYEVVCVVDGAQDNTLKEAKRIAKKQKKIQIVNLKTNHGKGYALRTGFKKANARFIGFIDGDGEIDPSALVTLYSRIKKDDVNIVIGSKNHPKSNVMYPFYRKVVSKCSQFIIFSLFSINATDTQAGVKLFREEVITKILPYLKIDRFAIDVEMLAIAAHFGFSEIVEVPITVKMEKGAALNFNYLFRFVKDILNTFVSIISLFFRLRVFGSL